MNHTDLDLGRARAVTRLDDSVSDLSLTDREALALAVADLIATERERCITVMKEQLERIDELFADSIADRRKALFASDRLAEVADFMRTGE